MSKINDYVDFFFFFAAPFHEQFRIKESKSLLWIHSHIDYGLKHKTDCVRLSLHANSLSNKNTRCNVGQFIYIPF